MRKYSGKNDSYLMAHKKEKVHDKTTKHKIHREHDNLHAHGALASKGELGGKFNSPFITDRATEGNDKGEEICRETIGDGLECVRGVVSFSCLPMTQCA